MISRAIYESLPFVCLTAGMEVIFVLETPWAWLPGVLLYCLGAYVWIARANNIARHPTQGVEAPAKTYPAGIKKALYEAAPFIYIFAGVICMSTFLRYEGEQSLPLTLAAAIMFFGAGFGSWLLRSTGRRYNLRFHRRHQ
ncbi:MAG TPA: hypothetical protein VIS52_04415 [Motiliproteus sp.]